MTSLFTHGWQKKGSKQIGIVAIIAGGVFGGLTALVYLFGFGAGLGEAAMAYLMSGSIFAVGMLLSMLASTPLNLDNRMQGWSGNYSG